MSHWSTRKQWTPVKVMFAVWIGIATLSIIVNIYFRVRLARHERDIEAAAASVLEASSSSLACSRSEILLVSDSDSACEVNFAGAAPCERETRCSR